MEAEARHTDPPIVEAILADPRRYGFFQAVRLLELCRPKAVPIGGIGPAKDEAIRLRPDTSLSHPRSSVSAIDRVVVRQAQAPAEDATPPPRHTTRFRITEAIIGLYGLRSPMPSVYAEEILVRDRDDDPVRDFLDIFHHRALSLLYRSWSRTRAEALYREDGSDPLSAILFCLAGIPRAYLPEHLPVPPMRLARYLGLFIRRSRPAEGLEAIVSDFLRGLEVRLLPYVAHLVAISGGQQNRLGRACSTLGRDMHLGKQVLDAGGKFTLRVGPVSYEQFLALAPGGATQTQVATLVNLYVGDGLDFDVEVGIRGEDKPACSLQARPGGVRLGVDMWLKAAAPRTSWVAIPPPRAALGDLASKKKVA